MWKRGSPSKPKTDAPAPASGAARGATLGLTPEDEALLDKLADLTVRHRMTVPAIFFHESVKPLSFVGSQAMHFFEPFVHAFLPVRDYERFALMMERRENLETLLIKIEGKDDAARHEETARRDRERLERDQRKDPR